MPQVSQHLRKAAAPNVKADGIVGDAATELLWVFLNGGLSLALVLLGGFFAGLTLALIGQDEITLRVLALSGHEPQKSNAKKVLALLKKGKHWVLVTLLLGNVIVNETLPVFLDKEMVGGWVAVVVSTCLIVVFGEIIPQSLCAKWGLSIGAKSSRLVKWLMFTLSPVGYPIALLLDHILGTYHDRTFSREGLQTLIMLHSVPRSPLNNPQRLHPEEASIVCNFLSLSTAPMLEIMTPINGVFSLGSDTILNETTRYRILKSGFSRIPVYRLGNMESFVGVLNIRCLIGLDFQECNVTVGEVELEGFRTVKPDMHLAEVLRIFRDREADMVVVTEGGICEGRALGLITFPDVIRGRASGTFSG